MRVTIFGSTGLLGRALMQEWKDDDITGLGSKDADISDASQTLKAIEQTKPEWIVLAAAYTNVDGCETNSQLAHAVNADGAANVAGAAKRFGSRLLFLSTDYVFDGSKTSPYQVDDHVNPQSVYGRTKAEAESRVRELLPDASIARTSWLFGVGGKCFPATILKLAETKKNIEVVDDQRGSPTYVVDLARAIIQLCRKDARGTVHVTNAGECSWFDFAREIIAEVGLETVVSPTTSEKFVRPAPRPKYSVLSPESLNDYGIVMPDWKNALQRYLGERQKIESNSAAVVPKS